MSILRTIERRANERRGASGTLPWGTTTPPANGMLGSPVAGTTVTEKSALQLAAVYGSVGVLADSVATLPLGVLDSTGPKRKQLPPSQLLTQPYAEISLMDWLVQFTISLALRGNFYGEITARDKNLYPTQIRPVHPNEARVTRKATGAPEYRFTGRVVPIDNVFHVRYMSVAGSLVGLNPIEYLKNTFGLARAAELYGGAFFQNSALPSGVIEIEGDLDEEEALALAAGWKQLHQGIGQAALPAVLTGGAKFNAISINPEDAQFLESRQFSQSEIAGMVFRIPPHMIGIVDRSTSWGTGIEQQETGFVRNTLSGYLRRFELAMTALHPPNQFVRFDIGHRLRGTKLARYQAYSLGILGGWLCADDIRSTEDMPPVPGGIGKTFLLPINTEPLKLALQGSMPGAPAPGAPAGAPAAPATPGGGTGGGGSATGTGGTPPTS